MKKLITFLALAAVAVGLIYAAVPTPGGNVGVAINPSGDYAFLNVDNNGAVIVAGNGGGDVVGPASATANAVTRYSGTTGKLVQDSSVTVSDTGIVVLTGSAGVLRLKNYTVATLPTGTRGDTAYVTDALTPTYLAVAVGGGAVVAPVFYNGTAWVTH